jgi:phosphate transport system substrate-binding protein
MTRLGSKATAALLGFTLCAGGPGTAARAAETVRINGSGATLEVMKVLNEAFLRLRPDLRIEMEKPLGSSGAIKALLAGALDLAVSSKVLSPEQVARGAQSRDFGRTPLVIVTEKSVPKSDITTRELEEIYAGTLRTWPNGEAIRIVLRPEADIDTTILRGLSPGLDRAITAAQNRPGMVTAATDPESDATVADMPGGIGASSLCSLIVAKPPLNALTLNGVKPSARTIADGSYPLAKRMSFVTTGSAPQGVRDLLAFIYSPAGRALAEQAGVLVAPEPAGNTP